MTDIRPLVKKYKRGYVRYIAKEAGRSAAWVHQNINREGSLAREIALKIIKEGQEKFGITREMENEILSNEARPPVH